MCPNHGSHCAGQVNQIKIDKHSIVNDSSNKRCGCCRQHTVANVCGGCGWCLQLSEVFPLVAQQRKKMLSVTTTILVWSLSLLNYYDKVFEYRRFFCPRTIGSRLDNLSRYFRLDLEVGALPLSPLVIWQDLKPAPQGPKSNALPLDHGV